MIPDLNIFASITRSVTIENHTPTVEDLDPMGFDFMVALDPPSRSRTNDGSPRDDMPYTVRWKAGLMGPYSGQPQAGWRLQLSRVKGRSYENLTYELLGDAREFRVGPMTEGMVASVLPVARLYPYVAECKAQDGTTLLEALDVALWSEREDHQATGTYETFTGEAPVEHASILANTSRLEIDGAKYRITSSITDLEGPRVKFDAVRSGA